MNSRSRSGASVRRFLPFFLCGLVAPLTSVGAQTQADLIALAKTLPLQRIGPSGSKPGEPLHLSIPIPPSGLAFPLAEMVVTREVLWLAKDIVATAADPLDPFDLTTVTTDILGRLPIPGNPNVSGKLNQIQVKELQVKQVAVDVSVAWTVTAGGTELTPDEDYLLAIGSRPTEADIKFAPTVFHDDEDATAPSKIANIKATVTLSANGVSSGAVPLEAPSTDGLPVPIPALGLPKILALFEDSNFGGWVAFLVPSDSKLRSRSSVEKKLESLIDIAASLGGIARFGAFATGLSGVANLLGSGEVRYHYGSLRHLQDMNVNGPGTVEDRATSLIFVGAPGTQVELYNDTNYDRGQGAITVFAPLRMVTMVNHLDNNKNDSMTSSPTKCVYVNAESDDDDGFHDNLSSVSFSDNMTPFELQGKKYYADEADQEESCRAHLN